MLEEAQVAVAEFHEKFGLPIREAPGIPEDSERDLRIALGDEEWAETREAMEKGDLPGIADGIVDLIYVLLGTAESYGFNASSVFVAVHEANMAKEGGGSRADGKILKPDGWTPPDIEDILLDQGWQK